MPLFSHAARSRAHVVAISLAAAFSLGVAPTIAAQTPGWHAKAQANASIFFGATQQQLIATESELSRSDSALRVEGAVHFNYGEATDASDVRSVNSRAFLGTLSIDAMPFARISPFVLGGAETSLEKRLAHRYSAGGGAKLVLAQSAAGNASVSLALIGEWSRAMPAVPPTSASLDESVARWSARVKGERKVGTRLTLSNTTFYQPVTSDFSHYVVLSTSQAAYDVGHALAVTASFVDNYDSEARGRGARSNNDGQILFGIQASY